MSKRILVVEDQPDNRQIIRDMLADTDYETTEAEDGEKALAAVAKERPDLILMGIQLPIMDGYEVTRQIKADPVVCKHMGRPLTPKRSALVHIKINSANDGTTNANNLEPPRALDRRAWREILLYS